MISREEIKKFAKISGADIFGIANIERFSDLPPERNPLSIFPETKSVIVVGRRIVRGAIRGVEEGTNFMNYQVYGYNWLENRFLALTTYKIASFIENKGWEAVPLPNLPPEIPPMGISVRENQPPPNVLLDFDDAAVRAGVGEIGYCRVLLTPEFGPRQRIQLILTDAQIEPDPIMKKKICGVDEGCKGFCPLNAFYGEEEITICGKKMKVGKINFEKCEKCKNGALENIYHPAGKPDRIAAFCIRGCIDYLEKTKRIKNRFLLPLRIREPWQIKEEINFYGEIKRS